MVACPGVDFAERTGMVRHGLVSGDRDLLLRFPGLIFDMAVFLRFGLLQTGLDFCPHGFRSRRRLTLRRLFRKGPEPFGQQQG